MFQTMDFDDITQCVNCRLEANKQIADLNLHANAVIGSRTTQSNLIGAPIDNCRLQANCSRYFVLYSSNPALARSVSTDAAITGGVYSMYCHTRRR